MHLVGSTDRRVRPFPPPAVSSAMPSTPALFFPGENKYEKNGASVLKRKNKRNQSYELLRRRDRNDSFVCSRKARNVAAVVCRATESAGSPCRGGDGNHLDLRVTMNSHSRHVNAYSQMIASLRFHDKYKNCLLNPRFELHFV